MTDTPSDPAATALVCQTFDRQMARLSPTDRRTVIAHVSKKFLNGGYDSDRAPLEAVSSVG